VSWRPDQQTQETIQGMVDALFAVAPDVLGIDEFIAGCDVTDMDLYGVGVGVYPRYIQCEIREYLQPVFYRGGLTLIVGDAVTVVHIRDGELYEVAGPSGATGSVIGIPHDLLSVTHTDTDPQVVTRGSLVVGDATPEWTELVAGIGHAILKMNAGGTDPAWAAFDWDDIAAAVAADMVHAHSAAGEGGTLDWDLVWADAVHDHSVAGEGGEVPLASLGGYTQGDVMIGGGADWEDLPVGAAEDILQVNAAGTEPEWEAAQDMGHYEPLVDGDAVNPELLFLATGDVVMGWIP